MKTRKTFFHRACLHVLTAVMAVTLFTVAAPTEAQAAGLLLKGMESLQLQLKIHSVIADEFEGKLYQIQTIRDWYGNFKV